MVRRIIYILIGSLLILTLILGLWWWFFSRGGGTSTPPNLFNSGGTKTDTTGGAGKGGNGKGTIGSNTGTGVPSVSGGTSGSGSGSGADGDIPNIPGADNDTSTDIPSGSDIPAGNDTGETVGGGGGFTFDTSFVFPTSTDIIWNDTYTFDPGTFHGLANTVYFNPTDVNDLNTNTVTGTPYITKVVGPDGKVIDIKNAGALAVLIAGCLFEYPLKVAGARVNGVLAGFTTGGLLKVQSNDSGQQINETTETLSQCLARTLGKIAVQMITDDIVNWINGGFEGKPAFVENFSKFFADVSDQAAGEYLQSSDFAFLCSPIQAQVRIALAQSYARRNNSPSCTLSDAANNVGGFLNGGFGKGGWQDFISYTTEPANNPFGAYQTLDTRFNASVQGQVANKQFEVDLGHGFLSYQQCDPVTASAGAPISARVGSTNCKIVTPGSAIESSLETAFGQSVQSLQVGDSIKQILSALANALITKALYGGLSNIGKDDSANNIDVAAQNAATSLLTDIQTSVRAAQNYGAAEQRIISDVQTAQQNAIELQNCWLVASTSSSLTDAQRATVAEGIVSASTRVLQLEAYVTTFNQNIQRANNSIVDIQTLQTDILSANDVNDVNAIKAAWTKLKTGSNPHIFTAADVTTAQQDRTSTLAALATINTDTNTKLLQCHAISGQ
jgi:hypothetical protein